MNVVRVLDILECKYNYTIHPLYNEYKLKKFVLKYVEIFIKNTVIKKRITLYFVDFKCRAFEGMDFLAMVCKLAWHGKVIFIWIQGKSCARRISFPFLLIFLFIFVCFIMYSMYCVPIRPPDILSCTLSQCSWTPFFFPICPSSSTSMWYVWIFYVCTCICISVCACLQACVSNHNYSMYMVLKAWHIQKTEFCRCFTSSLSLETFPVLSLALTRWDWCSV